MPGTLKTGLINLSNTLPIKLTIFVCESKLVITKKGKRDGTTQVAHKISPFLAATRLVLEKTTRHIVKAIKIKGNIKCFNFTI